MTIEESWEKIAKSIAQKQFEWKAKGSFIWQYRAMILYHAAEILIDKSKKADDDSLQLSLETLDIDGNPYYDSKADINSPERKQQRFELNLVSGVSIPAYFLLARAFELTLKGILIENDPNYFHTQQNDKQSFNTRKFSHDILKLAQECDILLNDTETEIIESLTTMSFWGIYPIPKNDTELFKQEKKRLKTPRTHYELTTRNFTEVSELFIKILETLNRIKKDNGKNILQIPKKKEEN